MCVGICKLCWDRFFNNTNWTFSSWKDTMRDSFLWLVHISEILSGAQYTITSKILFRPSDFRGHSLKQYFLVLMAWNRPPIKNGQFKKRCDPNCSEKEKVSISLMMHYHCSTVFILPWKYSSDSGWPEEINEKCPKSLKKCQFTEQNGWKCPFLVTLTRVARWNQLNYYITWLIIIN